MKRKWARSTLKTLYFKNRNSPRVLHIARIDNLVQLLLFLKISFLIVFDNTSCAKVKRFCDRICRCGQIFKTWKTLEIFKVNPHGKKNYWQGTGFHTFLSIFLVFFSKKYQKKHDEKRKSWTWKCPNNFHEDLGVLSINIFLKNFPGWFFTLLIFFDPKNATLEFHDLK